MRYEGNEIASEVETEIVSEVGTEIVSEVRRKRDCL